MSKGGSCVLKLNFGVTEDADRVQQHSKKSKNVSFMILSATEESLSYWLVGCFVKRR